MYRLPMNFHEPRMGSLWKLFGLFGLLVENYAGRWKPRDR